MTRVQVEKYVIHDFDVYGRSVDYENGIILAATVGAAQADLTEDLPAFREKVKPMIHRFIFTQYERFAASELTFRHLKQHVAFELGSPTHPKLHTSPV